MATMLNAEQMEKAKSFIFKNGRLLERKLFEYFFENGAKQACLKALLAYQNDDGGFGNGLELDLLCPDSTAIGAETAMSVLELLECYDSGIIDSLVHWIVANQNADGFINHPPKNLFHYPHQAWWENPDNDRVLSLAGLLKKWGIDNAGFFERVENFYSGARLPDADNFYGYPHLVYLKHCGVSNDHKSKLSAMIEQLPVLLEKHKNHFPLFGRHWFYAKEYVTESVLAQEAASFVNALQDDGGIENPYPDLAWWRPVFTLDGLILLKKWSFL